MDGLIDWGPSQFIVIDRPTVGIKREVSLDTPLAEDNIPPTYSLVPLIKDEPEFIDISSATIESDPITEGTGASEVDFLNSDETFARDDHALGSFSEKIFSPANLNHEFSKVSTLIPDKLVPEVIDISDEPDDTLEENLDGSFKDFEHGPVKYTMPYASAVHPSGIDTNLCGEIFLNCSRNYNPLVKGSHNFPHPEPLCSQFGALILNESASYKQLTEGLPEAPDGPELIIGNCDALLLPDEAPSLQGSEGLLNSNAQTTVALTAHQLVKNPVSKICREEKRNSRTKTRGKAKSKVRPTAKGETDKTYRVSRNSLNITSKSNRVLRSSTVQEPPSSDSSRTLISDNTQCLPASLSTNLHTTPFHSKTRLTGKVADSSVTITSAQSLSSNSQPTLHEKSLEIIPAPANSSNTILVANDQLTEENARVETSHSSSSIEQRESDEPVLLAQSLSVNSQTALNDSLKIILSPTCSFNTPLAASDQVIKETALVGTSTLDSSKTFEIVCDCSKETLTEVQTQTEVCSYCSNTSISHETEHLQGQISTAHNNQSLSNDETSSKAVNPSAPKGTKEQRKLKEPVLPAQPLSTENRIPCVNSSEVARLSKDFTNAMFVSKCSQCLSERTNTCTHDSRTSSSTSRDVAGFSVTEDPMKHRDSDQSATPTQPSSTQNCSGLNERNTEALQVPEITSETLPIPNAQEIRSLTESSDSSTTCQIDENTSDSGVSTTNDAFSLENLACKESRTNKPTDIVEEIHEKHQTPTDHLNDILSDETQCLSSSSSGDVSTEVTNPSVTQDTIEDKKLNHPITSVQSLSDKLTASNKKSSEIVKLSKDFANPLLAANIPSKEKKSSAISDYSTTSETDRDVSTSVPVIVENLSVKRKSAPPSILKRSLNKSKSLTLKTNKCHSKCSPTHLHHDRTPSSTQNSKEFSKPFVTKDTIKHQKAEKPVESLSLENGISPRRRSSEPVQLSETFSGAVTVSNEQSNQKNLTSASRTACKFDGNSSECRGSSGDRLLPCENVPEYKLRSKDSVDVAQKIAEEVPQDLQISSEGQLTEDLTDEAQRVSEEVPQELQTSSEGQLTKDLIDVVQRITEEVPQELQTSSLGQFTKDSIEEARRVSEEVSLELQTCSEVQLTEDLSGEAQRLSEEVPRELQTSSERQVTEDSIGNAQRLSEEVPQELQTSSEGQLTEDLTDEAQRLSNQAPQERHTSFGSNTSTSQRTLRSSKKGSTVTSARSSMHNSKESAKTATIPAVTCAKSPTKDSKSNEPAESNQSFPSENCTAPSKRSLRKQKITVIPEDVSFPEPASDYESDGPSADIENTSMTPNNQQRSSLSTKNSHTPTPLRMVSGKSSRAALTAKGYPKPNILTEELLRDDSLLPFESKSRPIPENVKSFLENHSLKDDDLTVKTVMVVSGPGSKKTVSFPGNLYHTSSKGWFCEICKKSFKCQSRLQNHMVAVHWGIRRFFCSVCPKTFPSIHTLNVHKYFSHQRKYQCPKCPYTFHRESFYDKHYASCHDFDFICHQCTPPMTFKDRPTLKAHRVKTHRAFKTCEFCGMTLRFNDKKKFERHMRKHREKKIQCMHCGRHFTSVRLLQEHWMTHDSTGKANHMCKICGKFFESKPEYVKHLKGHPSGRSFICEHCGNAYFTWGHLFWHLKVHSKERFVCAHCNREFALKHHLIQHLGTIACGGETAGLLTKRAKKRVEPKAEKPSTAKSKIKYTCALCSDSFSYKRLLLAHIKSSCGRNTSTIPKKAKVASKKSSFEPKKHYICAHCGECFALKRQLLAHVRDFCSKNTLTLSKKVKVVEEGNKKPKSEPKKQYNCAECCEFFAYKRQILVHIRNLCNKNTLSFSKKVKKVVEKKNKKPRSVLKKQYNCAHCGECFANKRQVSVHIRNSCVKNTSILSKKVEKVVEEKKEEPRSKPEKQNKCKHCGELFVFKRQLLAHISNSCDKTTSTSLLEAKNVVEKKSKKPSLQSKKQYSCASCGQCFITKSKLLVHFSKSCDSHTQPVKEQDLGKEDEESILKSINQDKNECFVSEHELTAHTKQSCESSTSAPLIEGEKVVEKEKKKLPLKSKEVSADSKQSCESTTSAPFIEAEKVVQEETEESVSKSERQFSCKNCGKCFGFKLQLLVHIRRSCASNPSTPMINNKKVVRKEMKLPLKSKSLSADPKQSCESSTSAPLIEAEKVVQKEMKKPLKSKSLSDDSKQSCERSTSVLLIEAEKVVQKETEESVSKSEKQFSCKNCGKCFGFKLQLLVHVRRSCASNSSTPLINAKKVVQKEMKLSLKSKSPSADAKQSCKSSTSAPVIEAEKVVQKEMKKPLKSRSLSADSKQSCESTTSAPLIKAEEVVHKEKKKLPLKSKSRHICASCGKCFIIKQQFVSHLRKCCGRNTLLRSRKAEKVTKQETNKSKLQLKSHTCAQCCTCFVSKQQLLAHRRTSCGRNNSKRAKEEEQIHEETKKSRLQPKNQFTCAQCGESFVTKRDFMAHSRESCGRNTLTRLRKVKEVIKEETKESRSQLKNQHVSVQRDTRSIIKRQVLSHPKKFDGKTLPQVKKVEEVTKEKSKKSRLQRKNEHTCARCGKFFLIKRQLLVHSKKCYGRNILKRSVKAQKVIKRETKELKLPKLQPQKQYACAQCGECFIIRRHLYDHSKKTCGRKALAQSTKSEVIKEEIKKTSFQPKNQYTCNCGESFVIKRLLLAHSDKCSPRNTLKRSIGAKKINKEEAKKLKLLPRKQYSCVQCGECFVIKRLLLVHSEKCGRNTLKRTVKAEVVKEETEKSRLQPKKHYSCAQCGESFVLKRHLFDHSKKSCARKILTPSTKAAVIKEESKKLRLQPKNQHTCAKCGESFIIERLLMAHSRKSCGTNTSTRSKQLKEVIKKDTKKSK